MRYWQKLLVANQKNPNFYKSCFNPMVRVFSVSRLGLMITERSKLDKKDTFRSDNQIVNLDSDQFFKKELFEKLTLKSKTFTTLTKKEITKIMKMKNVAQILSNEFLEKLNTPTPRTKNEKLLKTTNLLEILSTSMSYKLDQECDQIESHFNEINRLVMKEKARPTVFTDGACSNNGNAKAVAAIGVFWGKDHPLNVSRKLDGNATNNRAEIMAAIVAIEQAILYEASGLRILTDSKFLINSIQKWIVNWKQNGWISSVGKPVKNKDCLKKLDELCSKISVSWTYVVAHSGVYGNENADKLARAALKL